MSEQIEPTITYTIRTPREHRAHCVKVRAAIAGSAVSLVAAIMVPSPFDAIFGWLFS